MENNVAPTDVDASHPADASSSRDESLKRCIESLEHACQCRDANCRRATCHKLKKVVLHVKLCKKRTETGCPVCKQAIVLCCSHAKQCDLTACPVPFCSNIRQKLNEPVQERLLGLLREKCETCCEIPECECSLNVHNDRTKHAIHFNGSSAFCSQCGLPITPK